MSDCPADATEKPQGVVMVTPENDARKLNDLSFLTKFINVFTETVNAYCTLNKLGCCQELLPTVNNVAPSTGSLVVVTPSDTNIARGYPQSTGNGKARIQLIFKATHSQLLSQCTTSAASRRKRQTEPTEFINKQLLKDSLTANIANIQQELGITIESLSASQDVLATGVIIAISVGAAVFVVSMFLTTLVIRRIL
jgi:hypothetical protein